MVGEFFKSKIEHKATKKKDMKLDANAFCEERKRFNFQIHLIVISRSFRGPTGTHMTCVHLLTQVRFQFKHSGIQPKYSTDIPRQREEYYTLVGQERDQNHICLVR